ncbi:MAG: GHKL domain-containing protein [Deltaproteobacteria bacterium]|nr:GHKL domain-containing protein [Deltaproteobacteria bacterium]
MADQPRKKDHYRTLTLTMVAYVLAVSLIPLVLIGMITLHEFEASFGAKVREHLRELVERQSQGIEGFLQSRLGELTVFSRSRPLEQITEPYFLERTLSLFREEYGGAFVDIGVVDQDGLQLAYVGPFNLQGADYHKAPWFQAALKSDYYISDVFAGLRGTPHFIIAVGKTEDRRRYLVKATINFEAFNALVENIRVGDTGFAFIINKKGEFQTKPRFGVDLASTPYQRLLAGKLNPKDIPVWERPDARGRETIFAMAPLKDGEWVLCLQQTASDAFSEMFDTVTLAVLIIAATAVIIVITALVLSNNLVSRIRNSDEERAIIKEKVIETGRMASLGELAAGIAHEINNPVAIMVEEGGWIDDILSTDRPVGPEDLAEIRRAVQMIRTQGSRCKDITYKLLSFARKTDPIARPVDVNGLVEEVVGLLAQKSRFALVNMETHLAPDLPPVHVSPTEMQQVVLNLLNNAVDAINEKTGGVINITTGREGDRLVLAVEDSGEGIPEANLPRIFDPFFTTKPVGKGTGLGLSICYGIIDKMGGTIKVASSVGKGTTFTVSLPMTPGHEVSPEEMAQPSQPA